MCNNGITQFYLPPTHEPYLRLLPNRKASPPFGWYSLRLPTKRWPGWVNLGGWLHTEINVSHRELNPDTVIHPSTNRAQCSVTSMIETNKLPQCRILPAPSTGKMLKISCCDDVMSCVVLLLLLMSSVSVYLCSAADPVLPVTEFLKIMLPWSTKKHRKLHSLCN